MKGNVQYDSQIVLVTASTENIGKNCEPRIMVKTESYPCHIDGDRVFFGGENARLLVTLETPKVQLKDGFPSRITVFCRATDVATATSRLVEVFRAEHERLSMAVADLGKAIAGGIHQTAREALSFRSGRDSAALNCAV